MSLGTETPLEPRANSPVGSGAEREPATSAQVRRMGGQCKLNARVTEKYILKPPLIYFICSKKPFGKGISSCKLEKVQ